MKGRKIYFDGFDYDEAKRNADRLISRVDNIALILSNFKYTVSVETLKECLNVRFKEVKVNIIDRNFIGDRSQVTFIGDSRLIRVVDCAPLLAEECRKKVEKAKQMATNIDEEKGVEINLNCQFENMIHKVIDAREGRPFVLSEVFSLVAEHLTFDAQTFKAGTDDSFDETLKERCTVYCASKKAEKVMELHEQAASVLREMMAMIREDLIPEDMSGLFYYSDGKVEITPINYNKFLK